MTTLYIDRKAGRLVQSLCLKHDTVTPVLYYATDSHRYLYFAAHDIAAEICWTEEDYVHGHMYKLFQPAAFVDAFDFLHADGTLDPSETETETSDFPAIYSFYLSLFQFAQDRQTFAPWAVGCFSVLHETMQVVKDACVLFGINQNMVSLSYKVADKTLWGMYFDMRKSHPSIHLTLVSRFTF